MATKVQTLFEIRRRLVAITNASSQWETRDIDILIWRYRSGGTPECLEDACPPEYTPGLMVCYVNNWKVDLATFDRLLLAERMSRDQIELSLKADKIDRAKKKVGGPSS